jgi:hypothetical protein
MKPYDVHGTELKVGDYAFVIRNAYGVYFDNILPPRQIASIEQRTLHGTRVPRIRLRGDPPSFGRVPAHLMKSVNEITRKQKREPKGFAAFVTRIEK